MQNHDKYQDKRENHMLSLDGQRRNLLRLGGIATAGVGIMAAITPTSLADSPSNTFFNVKDFGAIGDGEANDQAAITAAISAASLLTGTEFEKNRKGGVVYLPAGTYLVDNIKLRRNITLMGEGMGTIVQQVDNRNTAVIANLSENDYPVIVKNLRIKGARNPSGNGLFARGIVLKSKTSYGGFTVPDGQHIIDQVWIERTHSDGIYIKKDCRGTLVKDCWIAKSQTKAGIWVDGSDTTIVNTVSRGHLSEQSGGNGGVGFKITSGNARLINCKSFFSRGGGFYVTGSRSNLNTCEAQDNWQDGFYLASSNSLVTGCLADSNQNAGYHIDPKGGFLGGICMSGFVSIGRPEMQTNKPWVGQSVGLRINNGNVNDSYFAGIVRDNNDQQLQITANLNVQSQTQNIVIG